MRVLHVDSGRVWRGGQNQVRLLLRELARKPEVHQSLFTKHGSELARRAGELAVSVTGVRWTFGMDPWAAWRLAWHLVSARPQIVHAHDSHALSVILLAFAMTERAVVKRWARGYERPRLIVTRRVDFHLRHARSWRRADRIIAISAAVKAMLVRDGIPDRDVVVVPSGIDAEEVRHAARRPSNVRSRLGLSPDALVAANVAALVDHKDQLTLVRAAARARALAPGLHWVIAGEGERRRLLEREIAAQGVADRVHLLGYVEEADALIREADVFVMSSKEEGLGSVVLDALALERPVVATAGGGLPEILPAECLVPVGDAEALALKVAQTLAHPPSPVPLPARFTARAMGDGVLAAYRSLV
ncbi:MAG TPA: glycosyltransferase [Gemmatimonadales bacterium]|nr:glycosyltransferase [Gemmatimonadales bacterium]